MLPDGAGRAPLPSVLTIANVVYALHAFAIMGVLTIWLTYRIGKGWLRLRDARPMYQD